jgi:hypothetical protein
MLPHSISSLARGAHGFVEAGHFGRNVLLFQAVMRHIVHAARDEMGPANSDTTTNGYTVQGDIHRPIPPQAG